MAEADVSPRLQDVSYLSGETRSVVVSSSAAEQTPRTSRTMDGLGYLDAPSEFVADQSVSAAPVFDAVGNVSLPSAAVPIIPLAPRYNLSEALSVVISSIFKDDAQRKVVTDLLANNGFTNCEDLCDLAKFWRKECAELDLSEADRHLHWQLIQLLCSGSQRHKSYDRFGKLVRAAAQKAAAAGDASGGDSRPAPSFAETSRHLRQCLERKAKDSAFYGVVLATYFPDGAALIGRQELVAPSSGVYCCFCSHQTAYTWCMDAKRDFKRLLEHLERQHQGDARLQKRPAASELAAPGSQKQRTLDNMLVPRPGGAPPPAASQQRF